MRETITSTSDARIISYAYLSWEWTLKSSRVGRFSRFTRCLCIFIGIVWGSFTTNGSWFSIPPLVQKGCHKRLNPSVPDIEKSWDYNARYTHHFVTSKSTKSTTARLLESSAVEWEILSGQQISRSQESTRAVIRCSAKYNHRLLIVCDHWIYWPDSKLTSTICDVELFGWLKVERSLLFRIRRIL